MIFTSYFAKVKKIPKSITRVSISLKLPYWYKDYFMPELYPTNEILDKWIHRETTHYTEEDYIRDYRRDVLSKLDPHEIYKILMKYSGNRSVVLLCYERDGVFCHRHIVEEWFIEHGIPCQEFKNMDETVITDLNILECSTKGDKRFSSFYAYVNVFGHGATIEHHYQSCKRFNDPSIKNPKGREPDYIEIVGLKLDKKYLTPYYKLLWVEYLDKHPELVQYASKFDDFHDIFRSYNSTNCQADVIRQYIKEGRESIMNEELVQEFLKLIKGDK